MINFGKQNLICHTYCCLVSDATTANSVLILHRSGEPHRPQRHQPISIQSQTTNDTCATN